MFTTAITASALHPLPALVIRGLFGQVQGHLRQVQKLFASAGAFAALRADQTVVTWGQADFGGDSSQVQHLLRKPPGLFRALRARRALLVSHFDVRCLKDRSRGTRGTFRGSRIGWVIVVTDLQLWPSNPQEFDTLQYG